MWFFHRFDLNRSSPASFRLTGLIKILLLGVFLIQSSGLTAEATTDRGAPADTSALLAMLSVGDSFASFEAAAIYHAGTDKLCGARFFHQPTGMPVDILLFDSIPQAMVWIQSPPISDRGEPHAGEHLVLGKGKKGKLFSLLLDMSMGSNSAATWRDKTLYHYHTAGGRQSFLELTYRMFDTLLHPDFTDEEIRREVAHLGVIEDLETGQLSIEERGTVYLEMISSFEKPGGLIWNQIRRYIYGADHPLGLESGGLPEAIREMEPHHIRQFFAHTYVPGPTIGLIVGLPISFDISRFLSDLDGIFRKSFNGFLAQISDSMYQHPAPELPPWQSPTASEIIRLPYPAVELDDPGCAVFGWNARADITMEERFRLEALWHLLAGDETAYLYKDLIDSSTKRGPEGIADLSGWINSTAGNPPMIWLDGLPPGVLEPVALESIRRIIGERLDRIASLEPGCEELALLNEKVNTYLASYQRSLRESVEVPPRFGFRGTSDFWYRQLCDLAESNEWKRDLLKTDPIQNLITDMQTGNIWSELIRTMDLVDGPVTIVAAYPDPDLPGRQHQAKLDRIERAEEELKRRYATVDKQEALRLYRAEFDIRTTELDALEQEIARPGFLPDPPLTLDDMINTQQDSINVMLPVESPQAATVEPETEPRVLAIPLCINRFEHTSQIETGLFFNLADTPAEELIYLPLLPFLITDLGCWQADSSWMPYDALSENLRRDINSLHANFSSFPQARSGRLELGVYGSGLGADEGLAAVAWMKQLLNSATRIESGARSRLIDILNREISRLKQLPLGSEEAWVDNPAQAYRYQRDKAYLSANSIFTKQHHFNRLIWRLRDVPTPDELAELEEALQYVLTQTDRSRENMGDKLTLLSSAADEDSLSSSLIRAAIAYLGGELGLLAEETLFSDLTRLTGQLLSDLSVEPQSVLDDLSRMMNSLLATGPSRTLITGNSENIHRIENVLFELTNEMIVSRLMANIDSAGGHSIRGALTGATNRRNGQYGEGVIVNNLKQRYEWLSNSSDAANGIPPYAALTLESTRNAVFVNSSPLTDYGNFQNGGKADYLASKLFAGSGAHGLFMKTWAAGLAYSNGIGSNARSGQVSYYAERCSDGTETVRYVTELLNNATDTIDDTFFLDYALANAFSDYRGGDTYISRGRAMARDLADGFGPERIQKFKRSLLRQRTRWQKTLETSSPPETKGYGDDFLTRMVESLPRIAGPVIPGYGSGVNSARGTVNFMIGPSDQINEFTEYLSTQEPQARPVRLYQSDFWID